MTTLRAYGSRKMRDWLRRKEYVVNRKRIKRLMRKMGLVSVAPKPNTSQPVPQHKIYPYLLRGLEIDRPNQVWCVDITYIRLAKGFVYLTRRDGLVHPLRLVLGESR